MTKVPLTLLIYFTLFMDSPFFTLRLPICLSYKTFVHCVSDLELPLQYMVKGTVILFYRRGGT